jgi:GNAT superfamily N-acetyltransferase
MSMPSVRDAGPEDVDHLARDFADWPKPRSLFEEYLDDAAAGKFDFLLGQVDGRIAGFALIEWESTYPPFAAAGIPEIFDLNVLPAYRRGGVARGLMDEAEARILRRSPTAGLRVGLYEDYGPAQRMYVLRGYVPDAAGVTVDGVRPVPGSTIVLDDDPVLALTKSLS